MMVGFHDMGHGLKIPQPDQDFCLVISGFWQGIDNWGSKEPEVRRFDRISFKSERSGEGGTSKLNPW